MGLYAFDGTWNEDRDGDLNDSNVVHFFGTSPDVNRRLLTGS